MDFETEKLLAKNEEMWNVQMDRLAKCYLEEQASIINYLTELNAECNRPLTIQKQTC